MDLFNRDDDRGQVGIGTLIVFIAMVLVAAIAAGVLVNTAGVLQENAEQTGQQSQEQVSNRLTVVSATAQADGTGSMDNASFTVTRASGSDNIDLNDVTVSVIGPDGTAEQIVSSGNGLSVRDPFSELASTTMLDDAGDRGVIDLEFGNANQLGSVVAPGTEVTVRFITPDGAVTTVQITVPDNLIGGETFRA